MNLVIKQKTKTSRIQKVQPVSFDTLVGKFKVLTNLSTTNNTQLRNVVRFGVRAIRRQKAEVAQATADHKAQKDHLNEVIGRDAARIKALQEEMVRKDLRFAKLLQQQEDNLSNQEASSAKEKVAHTRYMKLLLRSAACPYTTRHVIVR